MTSTVTEVTLATINSQSYESLSITFGLITILLLLLLLVQKETMRAAGGPRAEVWVRACNIAIVPLLLTFALIIIMRLVDLL